MSNVDEFGYGRVAPVEDWASDWDYYNAQWSNDPYPIWDDLKSKCPMAHSRRYNEGVWLPLTYDQIDLIAHDTSTFSSVHNGLSAGGFEERPKLPPIHSDPPEHLDLRRAILPFFSPKAIEAWRPHVTAHCEELASAIVARGSGDAAIDYAQHIPVHAIASILGVDPADGNMFRQWIINFLVYGPLDVEVRDEAMRATSEYMARQVTYRRERSGDDLISHLIGVEINGEPMSDDLIVRILVLQMVAGIDTTWSSIGAALWHLATHDDDRRRLVADPSMIPAAVEEMLRAYAPVFVNRVVTQDTVVDGVEIKEGDSVFMTFPIACRDESQFERANEVIIDREKNRHVAFGSGIHRCLGSNLARLEMNVAVETFLRHMPEFSLVDPEAVVWAPGQIRGPRSIPIVVS